MTPAGLVYQPGLLPVEVERALLDLLEPMEFEPIVMHGQAARRTALHYGLGYDYGSRTPKPGDPIPDWLLPVRAHAATLAGHEPDELVEALVQRYPPGSAIGWHRDAPAFGHVIGVSLAGACRMRFQRGKRAQREVAEVVLEPRSGYVLAGESRTAWQHSIPPTRELRYSITFRTLRA